MMAQSTVADKIRQLEDDNDHLRAEVEKLRAKISDQSLDDDEAPNPALFPHPTCLLTSAKSTTFTQSHSLTKSQVERYSRQLLLPSFGVAAQDRLSKASVLVVGCGGLGSPAALYLAAMGVGKLGLVDHDSVEISNLHRQIAHTEWRVGQHKGISAAEACRARNSSVDVKVHLMGLNAGNAVKIVSQYDVVIDASDNPPTRYLISDACAATNRPLVSGAAVGTDGQLTVYCAGDETPCYRCLFPESPAPENCSRCSDAGVLGVVPGVIGTLQALEAVKLVTGVGEPLRRRLLVFDALAGRFMSVKLRAKRADCVACGIEPVITADDVATYNYVAFTGQQATDGPPPPLRLLGGGDRVYAEELRARLQAALSTSLQDTAPQDAPPDDTPAPPQAVPPADPNSHHTSNGTHTHTLNLPPAVGNGGQNLKSHINGFSTTTTTAAAAAAGGGVSTTGISTSDSTGVSTSEIITNEYHGKLVLLDVRPTHQYGIMALPGAHCIPFDQFDQHVDRVKQLCGLGAETDQVAPEGRPEVYVICRRGNDSQRAVVRLQQMGVTWAKDVIGGYTAWAEEVDESMPLV